MVGTLALTDCTVSIKTAAGYRLLDGAYGKETPASLLTRPLKDPVKIVNFARENGIAVTAYSSFANTSFLELNMQIARNVPLLLSHPIITPIARKHDRTSAQVVLRWATQRGIAIIPKSNSKTRLLGNLRVNDFGLEQNEIDGISAFNRNLRFHNPLKSRLIGLE
ncbi:NAD(P)H-dependent D-xylose reductase [Histoplasma capsulatum G186AR]|uniref:NAD(P)H-dependent D-xylose reductase n=1 Tax=Ajellomyces capsulatus (strain G186AR / H82 / ATCC MYA-2454 / RMSCC 2432) TaxID=447093 RepID=C0NCC6_AJECG|nr:NAD(P)H-dependent D-xylose reductase [Histoplasma capsulatum G186AR]EEH11317.1 NAD(P)H-dependent D-xylose reductase [Histoplasma capsulatum G186AR]